MEYSEAYKKLMTEKSSQVEAAFKVATDIAMNHCLHHVQTDFAEAYPLVDMLTLEGESVNKGKEEIKLLLDAVLVDALMAYEGLIDTEQEG